MPELKTFLKSLISEAGISGAEEPVRALVAEAWKELVDEISVSRTGSLNALRRGAASEPRPALLLAAHMDAIGLMVTAVEQGFLRITAIGGIDPRTLPGQPVIVHGRSKIEGLVTLAPPHLRTNTSGELSGEDMFVDTGLPARRVERLVRPGDTISFAQEPLDLGENLLAGHSLDNRASVAALTYCLELLQPRQIPWDIWAVATSQEETLLLGAATSAFQIQPTLAIAVDVTFGSGPGSPGHKTFALEKGPTLGWGPVIHPRLYKDFKDLAEELEIPTSMEVMPRRTGTDADAMQVTALGIPTMVLSIPARYLHSPVEMVSMLDIRRTGRLLAEFATRLEADFMSKFGWDED